MYRRELFSIIFLTCEGIDLYSGVFGWIWLLGCIDWIDGADRIGRVDWTVLNDWVVWIDWRVAVRFPSLPSVSNRESHFEDFCRLL